MDIKFILRRARELGLTQAQQAAEVGCSQSTISEMASGKVGAINPSFKTVSGIQRMAEKHAIPLDPSPSRRRVPRTPSSVPGAD